MLQAVMIQHVHEFGHINARLLRASAHGQLVAEIAHRRQAHAWNTQVFAQRRRIFHVEFVERDDSIDRARARRVAYCAD